MANIGQPVPEGPTFVSVYAAADIEIEREEPRASLGSQAADELGTRVPEEPISPPGDDSVAPEADSPRSNTEGVSAEDLVAPTLGLNINSDDPYKSVVLRRRDGKEIGIFGQSLLERESEAFQGQGAQVQVPPRYLAATKGDGALAEKRWRDTLQWRKDNNINLLLRSRHSNFVTIKELYPTFFLGQTRAGLNVYCEQIGKIDLKGLRTKGITFDNLLQHYLFNAEFLYSYLDTREEGKTITILDLAGLKATRMPSDVRKFIMTANKLLGMHYPEKAAVVYIINVPVYFNVIWKVVSHLIDPVTKQKIRVIRGPKAVTKALLEQIDKDLLPKSYGGASSYELGESEEELLLRQLVEELDKRKPQGVHKAESRMEK